MTRVDASQDADIVLYSWGMDSKTPAPLCDARVDVSTYRNPETTNTLRSLSPLDDRVQAFIVEDPRVDALADGLLLWIEDRWASQTDSSPTGVETLSVLIVDHHGRLLGPAITEHIADRLTVTYGDGVYLAVKHLCIKE